MVSQTRKLQGLSDSIQCGPKQGRPAGETEVSLEGLHSGTSVKLKTERSKTKEALKASERRRDGQGRLAAKLVKGLVKPEWSQLVGILPHLAPDWGCSSSEVLNSPPCFLNVLLSQTWSVLLLRSH